MATLSQALKEAYAAMPAETIILDTIEIYHPAFRDENNNPASVRVVRDYQDLSAFLEADAPMNPGALVTFTALAFDVEGAGFGDNQVPQIEITLSNVTRELMKHLEEAQDSPAQATVIYREYMPSDLSGPQMDPPVRLQVSEVNCDVFRCVITADASSLQNRQFPNRAYTVSTFPGLNR